MPATDPEPRRPECGGRHLGGGWNDAQLAALLQEPPDEYDPDVIPSDEPVPPDLVWAPPPPDDVPASDSPGSTTVSASEPEAIEDVPAEGAPAEGFMDEPSERDPRSIRLPAFPAADVVVRLLGDIAVEGARKPLTGKQTAIVAYLAAHGTVTSDRLEDAIWLTPSTGPPGRRLINSTSECRGGLGGQHLPLATAGRYTVGPGVITDLELFDRHCEAARGQDLEGAAQALAQAFALDLAVTDADIVLTTTCPNFSPPRSPFEEAARSHPLPERTRRSTCSHRRPDRLRT